MKFAFTAIALSSILSLSAFAEGKAAQGADAQAIDSACTADAGTAGCGSEQVGTGLLKCLHAYKKAHHDFKFSDACKASMEKAHADHKAKK
jgi:hypothetical protein